MRAGPLLLTLLVACRTPVPFDATPPIDPAHGRHGFLRAEGTRLVDGAGKEVRLRGVNLGAWLLWEGWMWGAGWQSETDLMSRLGDLVGRADAARFRRRVHAEFITTADLERIAGLGFNTVRVPINHTLLEGDDAPFTMDPDGFAILDRLLDDCARLGLYAILDLHSAPGGQSGFYVADPGPVLLWDDAVLKDRTVAWWKSVAARYATHPGVGGYDLLNEPAAPDDTTLFDLYVRIADAIREVDSAHLIIVEGSDVARRFDGFPRRVTWNQANSVHQYAWVGDARADELAGFAEVTRAQGMPMFVGEFGLNSLEMFRSWVALFDDPAHEVAGYTFWSWKLAPGHVPGLAEFAMTPAWKRVVDWIATPLAARPTRAEALAGLDEFLAAARLDACTVNEQVADALTGRSVIAPEPAAP